MPLWTKLKDASEHIQYSYILNRFYPNTCTLPLLKARMYREVFLKTRLNWSNQELIRQRDCCGRNCKSREELHTDAVFHLYSLIFMVILSVDVQSISMDKWILSHIYNAVIWQWSAWRRFEMFNTAHKYFG